MYKLFLHEFIFFPFHLKLHVTVNIAKQVINLFLISHLTDMGWLDNIEYLFLFEKHTYTYIGEKNKIKKYTHTPTSKLYATINVAKQMINSFSINFILIYIHINFIFKTWISIIVPIKT